MFCKKCGKELKENARFCPACGTSVKLPTVEAAEDMKQTQNTVPETDKASAQSISPEPDKVTAQNVPPESQKSSAQNVSFESVIGNVRGGLFFVLTIIATYLVGLSGFMPTVTAYGESINMLDYIKVVIELVKVVIDEPDIMYIFEYMKAEDILLLIWLLVIPLFYIGCLIQTVVFTLKLIGGSERESIISTASKVMSRGLIYSASIAILIRNANTSLDELMYEIGYGIFGISIGTGIGCWLGIIIPFIGWFLLFPGARKKQK